MNDGAVNSICPDSAEQLQVLNFKRGILSLLQNSMPRYDLTHQTREVYTLKHLSTYHQIKIKINRLVYSFV